MSGIHITLIIIFGFIIVMTLILNKIKEERISPIADFIQKVMPTIPLSKMFKRKSKKKEKP